VTRGAMPVLQNAGGEFATVFVDHQVDHQVGNAALVRRIARVVDVGLTLDTRLFLRSCQSPTVPVYCQQAMLFVNFSHAGVSTVVLSVWKNLICIVCDK